MVKKLALVALLVIGGIMEAQAAEVKIDMNAIAQIESSGNPKAFNARTGARGLYQITDICRRDYNANARAAKYSKVDLMRPDVSRRIAEWYINKRIPQLLRALGLPDTLETRLVAYNAGAGKVKNPPQESLEYIEKYRDILRARK
jgi:membrane-bound lytic murein transglycosylase MltF